jgi:hypothetical protein
MNRSTALAGTVAAGVAGLLLVGPLGTAAHAERAEPPGTYGATYDSVAVCGELRPYVLDNLHLLREQNGPFW